MSFWTVVNVMILGTVTSNLQILMKSILMWSMSDFREFFHLSCEYTWSRSKCGLCEDIGNFCFKFENTHEVTQVSKMSKFGWVSNYNLTKTNRWFLWSKAWTNKLIYTEKRLCPKSGHVLWTIYPSLFNHIYSLDLYSILFLS